MFTKLVNPLLYRVVSILFIVIVSASYSAFSQSSLPVKDYTVGNRFVYSYLSTNGGSRPDIIEETVIKDTVIGNRLYGVVSSQYLQKDWFIGRYYVRSNDTAVYQYFLAEKSEKMIYRIGQYCANSLGASWFYADHICDTSPLANSLESKYSYYQYVNSFTDGQGQRFDAYNQGTIRYVKPFGIVNYWSKSCRPEYTTGHATRPEPGRYYQVCNSSTIELIGGSVNGKSIGDTIGTFLVSWLSPGSSVYGQNCRIGLQCVEKQTGLSASRYGVTDVSCSLTLDTALVQITEIQTKRGNKPDSLSYANGKLTLYCTFTYSPQSDTLRGFIIIQSKAVSETSLTLLADNVRTMPEREITTATSSLGLRKAPISFYIGKRTARDSCSYGQEVRLSFGLFNEDLATLALLPANLSCRIMIDTTSIDSIEVLLPIGEQRVTASRIKTNQNVRELEYTLPLQPSPTKMGVLRFRSKAFDPAVNIISIVGINPPPGFEYPWNYDQRLQQIGLTKVVAKSDVIDALKRGQNVINYIAPNPSTDNFTIRYAMGSSVERITVELLNSLGIHVRSFTLPQSTYGISDFTVNVGDLSPGMYLLTVRSNANIETQRVLISR